MKNRPRTQPLFSCLLAIVAMSTTSSLYGETRAPVDRALFDSALTKAAAMPRLHSLLISYDGHLVVEKYFNGQNRNRRANVKSVSKTIMSALIGIAIDQGHIGGLQQPVAEYYAELIDDEAKRDITVGHLLSMSAGLETTSFYNYGAWVVSPDWVAFQLRQPLLATPGSRMIYSTGYTHLLSAILTRATGQSTYRFARDALARPLGFELAEWPRDPQGIYFGGNNMELTPRQMLGFGELYLNGGRADGRQVIPASWVETSLTPVVRSRRDSARQYGYGWWTRKMAGVDTAFAWGYGGQFILLAPDLDLVVVTTSSSIPGDTRRRHIRGLYDLLEDDIIAPAAHAVAHAFN